MQKHKLSLQYTNFLILAMVVVMIVIVCRYTFIIESPLIYNIDFREDVCGKTLEPYYDYKENVFYLFLPSYVSPEDISIGCSRFVNVDFSDENVDYGDSLDDIPLKENIVLTLTNFYKQEVYDIQIWCCGNVPTLYLDMLSGTLDELNADGNLEMDTSVILVNPDGTVELRDDLATVSGRGNGSWSSTEERWKNPYSLEFSSNVDFGSFESVDKLCLLANYSDESRIRNSISYYIGESLGISYASPYMNVDVYVDGEYIGLYGLTTKNEYKNYIDTDQITAVFEMQISNTSQSEETFDSDFVNRVNVMYGSFDEIKESVGLFETALRTQDWELCHSVTDLHSFAEKYIFEEFIANNDLAFGSAYQSKYFYLDNEGVIHCMLPWDYDWSFGNSISYFNDLQTYELKVYRNSGNWFEKLLDDDEFTDEIVNILNEEFTDEYLDELCQYVSDLTKEVDLSWQCDIRRWESGNQYDYWMKDYAFESMEEYEEYFNNYFYERREFLIDCFSDFDNYCKIELKIDTEYFNMFVPKGTDIRPYLVGANILDSDRKPKYEQNVPITSEGISVYDIDVLTEDMTFYGGWQYIEETVEVQENDTEETESMALEKLTGAEPEMTEKFSVVSELENIYEFLGLEAFGRRYLILCALFIIVLLGMICREIFKDIRRRRAEKWKNI